MHDEQDLRQMGGLRRAMPITAVTMGIGALALAGFPFLAGFFAKDLVLEIAETTGHWTYYALGTLGAVLSVLYIGRLWFLTFGGGARSERAEHAHESPPIFWVPLAVLAAAATLAGLLSTTAGGEPRDLAAIGGRDRRGGHAGPRDARCSTRSRSRSPSWGSRWPGGSTGRAASTGRRSATASSRCPGPRSTAGTSIAPTTPR